MSSLSLYNLLVGQFISENTNPDVTDIDHFDNFSEDQKLSLSIIENLRMILSSRKGSVLHLPDFGMPDILQLYVDSGNPVESLKKELHDVILKYEPRIGEVRFEESEFDQKMLRASLKIIIKIKDNPNKEILITEFSTTGWTKVIQQRDVK
jgi:type VI secretion system protein